MLVRKHIERDLHIIFILKAIFKHVKLQYAHDAHDDLFEAAVQLLKDLDGAFLGDLVDAFDKLFTLHRIDLAHSGKMFRGEGRDAFEGKLVSRCADRIADAENARIEHPDDVPGVGLFHHVALFRHHLLRLEKAHLFVALHMIYFFGRFKFARADAHEGDPVTMGFVHVGLDFEHEGREHVIHGIDHPGIRDSRKRRCGHLQEMLQESFHAKVGERGAEEHRCKSSGAHFFLVEIGTGAVEQLDLLQQLFLLLGVHHAVDAVILYRDLFDHAFFCTLLCIGENEHISRVAVVHAAELFARPDRPVDRAGGDPQLFFDLIQKIKRVVRVPVHLVDEGEDRDVAHDAYFEQLTGLRLDTLRSVDDHDGGIGGHQGTVGVFREVLMSRGVQDIDAFSVIVELQDRRSDRDTSLLLDLHPVRHGVARCSLALYAAGQVDRSAVKQKFFGQCCFAGIGVRDDGKGSSFFDFVRKL